MVFRIVTAQIVYRIVTTVTILKKISIVDRVGYFVIFHHISSGRSTCRSTYGTDGAYKVRRIKIILFNCSME